MKGDVPSPATEVIPAANGMRKPPCETALYKAVAAKDAEIEELRRERAELLLQNHKLRASLRTARERLENWKLRQASWRRERAALLERAQRKDF